MRLLKTSLPVLILLSIASAAPTDFTPILPITAVVVVIFLALMTMLSSAISAPPLAAWAKSELREVLAGVILIVIIYAFFISSKEITSVITGTGDYLGASTDIISNMLTNRSTGYDRSFDDIIRAGTRLRAAATYSPYMSANVYIFGLTYSSAPLSGIGILFSSLSAATQGLSNVIFLYEGILLMLKFSATAVPNVLLPISLSLRLIPFTRRIGNTLIAVCLGVMVLLPFSVIFIGIMHQQITYPKAYLTSSQLDEIDPGTWAMTVAEPFCKLMPVRIILGLTDLFFPLIPCSLLLLYPPTIALFEPCKQLLTFIYFLLMMILTIAYDASLIAWTTIAREGIDYANTAFGIIHPFLAQVNNVVLLGYLDAIIIAVITISGARSISTALGGEWYLAGIQRLI